MWKIKCVLRESTFHVKKMNIFRQVMKNGRAQGWVSGEIPLLHLCVASGGLFLCESNCTRAGLISVLMTLKEDRQLLWHLLH